MSCTFALQSVSRSEFACTEWRFVPRSCSAAWRLSASFVPAKKPRSPSLQKFPVSLHPFQTSLRRLLAGNNLVCKVLPAYYLGSAELNPKERCQGNVKERIRNSKRRSFENRGLLKIAVKLLA